MKWIGFAITGYDILGNHLRREHFKKIREWGFNAVEITFWWSFFEPDQNRIGEYHAENLRVFEESIKVIREEGLDVILSARVCYDSVEMPDWAGWSTHDYVNMTEDGLNRFCALWQMLIQRFPQCHYSLWHCPYHRQGNMSESQKSRFWNQTLPRIVAAAREYTSKQLGVAPPWTGYCDGRESCWYENHEPLSDSNLMYEVGHTITYDITTGSNWNHDEADMDRQFAGIKRWRERGLPLMSNEYAPIEWHLGEPIHQSRLDCLQSSVNRMKQYDVGYMYWRISGYQTEYDNILRDIPSITPVQEILDIIKPDGVVPPPPPPPEEEFPWKWIALTMGVIAIIYFTQK